MRKPLTVRILSALDSKQWLALGIFLALALIAVPVLHLAVPESSPFHFSTYMITLIGKIMCYALVAVSYTHLDVYKRQVSAWVMIEK